MKKYVVGIFLALLLSIPFMAKADEKQYEYFDINAKRINGENIKNTDISIYASIEGDEENLIDRTSEFNVVEVMWSVCVDADCSLAEEVSDEAVFEEDKDYYLMMRMNAKNGADIDVWGTDKVKFNGILIDELSGEFGNTGKELMIKTRTNTDSLEISTETPEVISTNEEDVETIGAIKTCPLGISLCCNTFLGLSICAWILIVLIIILVIIVICLLRSKKKEENIVQQ